MSNYSERRMLDWVDNNADSIVTAFQATEDSLRRTVHHSNGVATNDLLRANAHKWRLMCEEFERLHNALSEGDTT